MMIRRKYNAGRFVTMCGALTLGFALVGCHSDPPVDVSKGSYGKADTATQLPPQPNVQDVIKKHQQGGGAAPGGAAVPSSGSSMGH